MSFCQWRTVQARRAGNSFVSFGKQEQKAMDRNWYTWTWGRISSCPALNREQRGDGASLTEDVPEFSGCNPVPWDGPTGAGRWHQDPLWSLPGWDFCGIPDFCEMPEAASNQAEQGNVPLPGLHLLGEEHWAVQGWLLSPPSSIKLTSAQEQKQMQNRWESELGAWSEWANNPWSIQWQIPLSYTELILFYFFFLSPAPSISWNNISPLSRAVLCSAGLSAWQVGDLLCNV